MTMNVSERNRANDLLDKSLPTYRQAYSDRTAWLMACLSELAYRRFNPLFSSGDQKAWFLENIAKLIDDGRKASPPETCRQRWLRRRGGAGHPGRLAELPETGTFGNVRQGWDPGHSGFRRGLHRAGISGDRSDEHPGHQVGCEGQQARLRIGRENAFGLP